MRHRLIAGHICVALIIAVGALTAVIALRSTSRQAERARHIDSRVAVLDGLRSDLRELGFAVRTHVLHGSVATQERVFAVLQRIASARNQLQARETLPNGGVLEADIEEYVAALLTGMSREAPDAMARIVQFEEDLSRVRGQLMKRFDDVIRGERARRDSARGVQTLALRAQWAIVAASALGIVLLWLIARHALQRSPVVATTVETTPSEPAMLRS